MTKCKSQLKSERYEIYYKTYEKIWSIPDTASIFCVSEQTIKNAIQWIDLGRPPDLIIGRPCILTEEIKIFIHIQTYNIHNLSASELYVQIFKKFRISVGHTVIVVYYEYLTAKLKLHFFGS